MEYIAKNVKSKTKTSVPKIKNKIIETNDKIQIFSLYLNEKMNKGAPIANANIGIGKKLSISTLIFVYLLFITS